MTDVVFAASEGGAWSSSGGLADVIDALPLALQGLDGGRGPIRCHLFLPLYRQTRRRAEAMGARLVPTGVEVEARLDGRCLQGDIFTLGPDEEAAGRPSVYFVNCPTFFDRRGLYHDNAHVPFADNPLRYAFFCRAVLQAAPRLLGGPPAIVHAHDWQTGLLPVHMRLDGWRQTRAVFTIHNLGYLGTCDKSWVRRLGLPWEHFDLPGYEFYDQLSLLKAGVSFADAVTTVSPSYAREMTGRAGGNGLHEHLRGLGARLSGIRNGIDTASWDPSTDPLIPARFSAEDLRGKATCRRAMLREMGLDPEDGGLVIACVSRLAWQKGIDLVAAAAPELVQAGARLVLLGDGEPGLEHALRSLAARHPGQIAVHIGYDRALSHRIEAGADAFLMPSRYEPCGLNQMYSMAYGTIPLVHATGGLRDTVVDATEAAIAAGTATGFAFEHADTGGILHATGRALHTWRERRGVWRRMMRAGMRRDWGWGEPAAAYAALYRSLLGALEIHGP